MEQDFDMLQMVHCKNLPQVYFKVPWSTTANKKEWIVGIAKKQSSSNDTSTPTYRDCIQNI